MPIEFLLKLNAVLYFLLDHDRFPGPEDVVVDVTHCGICYAEIVWTKNYLGDVQYPVVPGYVIHFSSFQFSTARKNASFLESRIQKPVVTLIIPVKFL